MNHQQLIPSGYRNENEKGLNYKAEMSKSLVKMNSIQLLYCVYPKEKKVMDAE